MIFHILVGQRKCSYPGQYAPEALEVMDDNGMSDNPDWMMLRQLDYEMSNEFDSLKVVKVFVHSDYIDEILFPPEPIPVDGLILHDE